MENRDCFAYTERNGHRGCKSLKDLYCKNEECKFYKRKCEVNLDEIEKSIKEYSKY